MENVLRAPLDTPGDLEQIGNVTAGAEPVGTGAGKMRSGWLVDLGGVSGHIAGLAEVHLLGDHRGGLVDGGHSSTLCCCGVRSRGSWLSISYWGMGDNWASRVVLSSISNGGSSSSNWSNSSNWGSSSIAKTMDSSKTKSCIGASHGQISRGAIGTSHHKGKGHLE